MFVVTLCLAHTTRRYSVSAAACAGWEIRIEEDSQVRRLDHCHDWHRVERAIDRFTREAAALQASGWRVVHGESTKR